MLGALRLRKAQRTANEFSTLKGPPCNVYAIPSKVMANVFGQGIGKLASPTISLLRQLSTCQWPTRVKGAKLPAGDFMRLALQGSQANV